MTPMEIYLWIKLDDIRAALGTGFVVFGAIGTLAIVMGAPLLAMECKMSFRKWALIACIPLAGWLFGLLYALVPSTAQAAAIIVAPKIINSEVVQRDIPQLYDMGVELLKQKMTEAAKTEVVK